MVQPITVFRVAAVDFKMWPVCDAKRSMQVHTFMGKRRCARRLYNQIDQEKQEQKQKGKKTHHKVGHR
jgi:hypothetical protein